MRVLLLVLTITNFEVDAETEVVVEFEFEFEYDIKLDRHPFILYKSTFIILATREGASLYNFFLLPGFILIKKCFAHTKRSLADLFHG